MLEKQEQVILIFEDLPVVELSHLKQEQEASEFPIQILQQLVLNKTYFPSAMYCIVMIWEDQKHGVLVMDLTWVKLN